MFESVLISMPMFVCGVLTLELLFTLRGRWCDVRVWLLLWAAVATVLYACHYLFFSRVLWSLPLSDSIYVACNLAVYPLYLVYIYKLTDRRPLSSWLRWGGAAYVLASLSLLAMVTTFYACMTAEELRTFFSHYLYHPQRFRLTGLPAAQALAHDACKVVFAVGVVATVVIGAGRIRRFNRLVDQLYADTDGKSLRSLQAMLAGFLLTAAVSLLVNVLGRQWFIGPHNATCLWLMASSVVFSVLLCAIGWIGLGQQFSIADIGNAPLEDDLPPGDDGKMETVVADFVRLMDKEHLYLQPNLRLDTVVRHMNTNRTYLLAALAGKLGMTFTEYVNRRRVEYANTLIARNPDLTRQEVAMACGYNSASTFYRNYRKYAGKALI